MKTPIASLAAILALPAFLSSAHAAVLIDFGRTNNQSGPTAGGPVYNNIAVPTVPHGDWNESTFTGIDLIVGGTATGSSTAALLDTAGAASGWSVTLAGMTQSPTVGTNGIFTPAAAAAYTGPIGPIASGLFLIDGASATGAANTALHDQITLQNGTILRVTISGLDDSFTYDLTAFTGRGNTFDNTDGIWSMTTGIAVDAFFQDGAGNIIANTGQGIDADDNAGMTVGWNGVQSVGGTIAFDIISPTPEGSGGTIDLNALSVVQIPEPSGALLAGLGAFTLLRRRRK